MCIRDRWNDFPVWSDGLALWLDDLLAWLNGSALWLDDLLAWLNGSALWLDDLLVWLNGSALWLDCLLAWLNGSAVWLDDLLVWLNGSAVWLDGLLAWLNGSAMRRNDTPANQNEVFARKTTISTRFRDSIASLRWERHEPRAAQSMAAAKMRKTGTKAAYLILFHL